MMDYGKFKYEEAKRAHEAKLKQKVIQVKEVKFRPGTDDGDYNVKLRNLRASWKRATRPRSRCASAAVKWRTRKSARACSSV
jgi:translation initiation factor IF-3